MTSLSYYHKPRSIPLDNRTLHQILDDNTTKHPDKELFVFYDANQHRSSLTFKQLKDQSIKFAASLLRLGFKRGDRILLYTENSLEFVVSWMAISRVGACAVLAHFTEQEWESFEILKRRKCTGLIVGMNVPADQRNRIAREIMKVADQKNKEGENYAKVIITIGNADINHPRILQYENLIQNDTDQAEVIATGSKVDADDLAFAFFSSGSNHAVKCVTFTHHAAINGVNSGQDKSVGFCMKPMQRGHGASSLLNAIIGGRSTFVCTVCRLVTIQDSYKHMLDIVQAEKCAHHGIPPQDVHQFVRDRLYENYDMSNLVAFGIGSQIIHRTTYEALLDALPDKKIVLPYASSETLLIAIQMISSETIKNKEEYGKMNIPSGIEVKVIDDQGQVVPLGTKGEICVRGPKMFLEYLEDPVKTSKTKKSSGWVHTSDYGIMYDRARIKVLGRQTDMIVTSNQAVFSVEIEEILLENPDVQEAVAVGVPNKDNKEDICACVIEVPGCNLEARVDELGKWCKKAFMEYTKPASVVFLESFPLTQVGKFDRIAIKRLAQEMKKHSLN